VNFFLATPNTYVTPKGQKEIHAALDAEEKRMARMGSTPGAPVTQQLPTVETKFPASKSQRLVDLLQKYRSDQLTPAEYHSQRAKILAE